MSEMSLLEAAVLVEDGHLDSGDDAMKQALRTLIDHARKGEGARGAEYEVGYSAGFRACRMAEPRELTTFARWLVAMDDPNDASGMRARQTVTLTSIIGWARNALAADGYS